MVEVPSNEPPELVEHFFRHESANLVAVLTRAFGIRHLDRIEDAVQDALLVAVQRWSRHGPPANPAGWIYRVARNRLLDSLRREAVHQRAVSFAKTTDATIDHLIETWLAADRLPDSLLRMIFVCAHPALDRRSQIALTLKVLCGFSLAEIARGLLISTEAAKKRVQRAKKTMERLDVRVELPPTPELEARLSAVHQSLYLLFNEGYSASLGEQPIRDELCEEAARLCHLLTSHPAFDTPATRALIALMAAHGARMDARLDGDGAAVLLGDQDRSRWDRRLIATATDWFDRSKTDRPTRYHLEAAIALAHCHAPSLEATDWPLIVGLYDRLLDLHDSPLYVLNRAIARGEMGDVDRGSAELESLRDHPEMRRYLWLDCARGRLFELARDLPSAIEAYSRALAATDTPHEQAVIAERLARLRRASRPRSGGTRR